MKSNESDAQNKNTHKKWVIWASYLAIPLAVYFANVEFQSYLGRQALADTGLEMLTLNNAFTKARAEGKLVLAEMSAIWCTTCRKLDREVLSADMVKSAISKDYIFSRIEYESAEGEAFMSKYRVSSFPTLLILDANGKKISHLPLTFSPEEFVKLISHF